MLAIATPILKELEFGAITYKLSGYVEADITGISGHYKCVTTQYAEPDEVWRIDDSKAYRLTGFPKESSQVVMLLYETPDGDRDYKDAKLALY